MALIVGNLADVMQNHKLKYRWPIRLSIVE